MPERNLGQSQVYRCKLVKPLTPSRKQGERKAENHIPSLKYLLKTGCQEGEQKIMFERRRWLFKGWKERLYLHGYGINLTSHLRQIENQLGTQNETNT